MIELAFNLDFFLEFELTNLLKLIKIGFYVFFMIYFFSRIKPRKKDGDPIIFEVLVCLFFLFMALGSTWEIFCLVFDPIFLHPGVFYFYNLVLLPTGFSGMALVYFLGFIGLGFLSLGIEKGSNLPTKGFISLIPFSLSAGLLLFGMLAITMPWYGLAFFAIIVPALFFYIAYKAKGGIRTKALFYAFGFILIFAGESMNINLTLRNFPELVNFFIAMYGYPIHFTLPIYSIAGCVLLIIAQIKYRD